MTTIKEIAELAGVSRGTVDRVLNNRGSVNKDTEKRIKEIVESFEYTPNRAGIVLAAQKKKLKLGVILFSVDNPFFEDVLAGIDEKAEALAGYNCSVIVKQVHFNVTEQLQAIDELLAEEVSGIAMAPYNHPSIIQKIDKLYDIGIPVVTLNTDIEGSKRIAYVGSHYTHSGETAAGLMHLITSGNVQVGIISGSPDILCHTERVAGFRNTVHDHYPNIHIVATCDNHDDDAESYGKTKAMLKAHPDLDALFFAAAGVAGGCRAVTDLKLTGKLKIIAFDQVPTTKELVKNGVIAATICQQAKHQGTKPLDLLFAYLTAGEMPASEYYYMAVDIRIKENI